ncbi:class I SAM-dependent methyltransferase [Stagnimonas aquatica]|uniref:Class I SAM-dependent methyltransferase n=1 Tax=Stagnimonas aquatica TaxID=2689987 RepID=A0A3N0V1B8_9GAMM|nr:class I SAM-dependent methyltransferase [Stagnimonas aquatica]ROH86505.1 class I SAM-dependent methyltransferase [Stagnimonas aquatica]
MTMEQRQDHEQARLWNGVAGAAWVELQATLDALFRPFETRLVAALADGADQTVLDIGCGTGATALALAQCLGAGGQVLGIDISEPMIAHAQARTRHQRTRAPVAFLCADAEHHAFEPGRFDRIVSRFGVMFFADPVAAFGNLRRAARAAAQLHLIAWRHPGENAFMTTAERAAAPLLPASPPRAPDAPGQFAFADRARVRLLLEEAGWRDVAITPLDMECRMPESALEPYFTRLGNLGRLWPSLAPDLRERLIATVRPAFAPFLRDGEVCFTAACWEIAATA